MNRWLLKALGILALAMLANAPALAADTVYYYYTDTLHSAAAITDASGNVVERTYYAPYGQVLNRPLRDGPAYTGQYEDPVTGLDYMQQRYYDPTSGRFVSTDPVGVNADGENFNRYWYANDNPYRYTDPDGRCPECIGAAIGAVLEILIQYRNPEDHAAYAAAASDLAHGHFIAAWRAAGPQAAKVLISAGAGATGAGLAGKVGELADVAAQATNASVAGKVTVGALVEVSGNAAAGAGINTAAQVAKNVVSGQPLGQGTGTAAKAGAIGGALGGATKVGFMSSAQRQANATRMFTGTSNGQMAAPDAIPAGTERAAASVTESATHVAMCKDKTSGAC